MGILTGPYIIGGPVDSDSRSTTQELPLGARQYDEAGGEYLYVKAAEALTSGEPVSVASGLGSASDDVTGFVGIAEEPFASGEYGFIKTRGVAAAMVASGVAVGEALFPDGSAALDTAANTDVVQKGVFALEANAGAAAIKNVFLQ